MWTFDVVKGEFRDPDGKLVTAAAYAGHGDGKNNPALEYLHDVGPLPRGTYTIGAPHTDPEKGPLVMPLIARPDVDTFGRGGFLIHGDSIDAPGTASHGCIILPRFARQLVADSTERTVQVV
jgi:hypothetical protein